MSSRRLLGRVRIAGLLLGKLLLAVPASGAPSASQKAAAEALFDEGTELMQKQRFAEACGKFEASNAIDPGLGVKLWLADCYDRVGRTASAWGLFSEAAAIAHQSSQAERERLANERAADLEQRLSKLELRPPAGGLPDGSSVTLNGTTIPAASVGSALPVDPGDEVIVVRAPGFQTLTLRRSVPPGPASILLSVPPLEPEPVASAPRDARAPGGDRGTKPAAPGSTQRLLAYSIGGLGVASLAGGALLAFRAHALDGQSREHCLVEEPNACTVEGASLREEAQNYGNVATAAVIAGGVLAATGVVLFITAPSGKHVSARVGASVASGGGSLFLRGRF